MRSRGLSTTSEQVPLVDVEIVEDDHDPYVRAAGDKLRVAVATVVFLVALLVAAVLSSLVSGAEEDVERATRFVPDSIAKLLITLGQYMGVLAPVAITIAVVYLRRLRVAIMVLIATIAACVLLWGISKFLEVQTVVLPGDLGQIRGITFPGPYFLAMGAAIVTVVGPWFNRALRRLAIGTVVFVAFTRIASNSNRPYDVVMSAALGWLVGTVVVAFFGSPNRHPQGADVADALRRAGLDPRRLELVGEGVRGSTVYVADGRDGARRFVKVFSSDQRDADLLLQAYRWVRIRDAGDERPFSSLRRAVEHEALIALKATSDGIPTARLDAVAEVDPEGMLLAFDFVTGEVPEGKGSDISDAVLRKIWGVAADLQAHHLAHRDLRLAHLLVDENDSVMIVDFSFAELAAHPTQLRTDIAELLCSTAVEVGPARAVAAAVDVLGKASLGDALGRIQPLALTSHTRRAVSAQDGLLEQIQAEVQHVTGLEEVEYEELARVKPRTVVKIVVLAVAIYALLPQLADVGGIFDELSRATWVWLLPVVVFQGLTYIGAAMGMIGGVPDRVAFLPTVRAQVAAAFVDVLAPAGVAGMALNTRYMQKRGVEPAVAVAGVGVNAVGGFIGHILLLGGFILWAGTSTLDSATGGEQSVQLPGWQTFGLIALGVLVMIGLVFIVPPGRRFLVGRVRPLVGDALRGLGQLARRPVKLMLVVGGSIVVTLGFTMAFVCTVQAFGGGVSVAQLGVAYLAAWAVAVFAPTPGGLGALEVALIAALGRLGMDTDAAVSSVLVFRTFTFWLPVFPGWITFNWLQRHGEI